MFKNSQRKAREIITNAPNDTAYVVIDADELPEGLTTAGEVDRYLTKEFGGIISRDPNRPNGVTVTAQSIVIAINDNVSEQVRNGIAARLNAKNER
jgi:hypothetical protein